jgi:peptidoglycan glycosyltransferase
MSRRIRWLGVVLLICFALVVVQLVNIQFRQAGALANSPFNPRIAAKALDNQRGTIMAADGTVLARSVKTTDSSDQYHYTRVYPQGPLYAGITGYDSLFYGTSGIEYEYNQ